MAFKAGDMSVLAYANCFTLWHYKTEDRWEDVLSVGYFDPAEVMLREGDVAYVRCADHITAQVTIMAVDGKLTGQVM